MISIMPNLDKVTIQELHIKGEEIIQLHVEPTIIGLCTWIVEHSLMCLKCKALNVDLKHVLRALGFVCVIVHFRNVPQS